MMIGATAANVGRNAELRLDVRRVERGDREPDAAAAKAVRHGGQHQVLGRQPAVGDVTKLVPTVAQMTTSVPAS